MCGHVGIAGNLEFKDEATFKRLLLLDYFRGPDSTGVAVLNKARTEAKIAKIASHPLDLFDSVKYRTAVTGTTSSVFLGHNRAATRGKVNGANAHPFECGHIIGAHNGTLEPSSFLALETSLGEQFDVDSEAIFKHIEKFGIEATVPLMQGAWALVWIDLSDGTINFLRNKERTFWLAYSDKCDKIFWASEWKTIDWSVEASTQPYKMWVDEEGYFFFPTELDTHLKFDLKDLIAGNKEGKKPEPISSNVIKGKESPANKPAQGVPFSWDKSGWTEPSWKTNSKNGGSGANQKTILQLVVDNDKVQNPFKNIITTLEFNIMAANGCNWCGEEVDLEEEGVVVFQKEDVVLCSKCSPSSTTAIFVDDMDEAEYKSKLN